MTPLTILRWTHGKPEPVSLVDAMRKLPPNLLYFGFDTGEVNESGLAKYGDRIGRAGFDAPSEVAHCLHYLSETCEHAKRGGIYSYALKHMVEQWLRDRGQSHYISTGSAIAAAILAGFEVRRAEDPRNPNATVVGLRLIRPDKKASQPKRRRDKPLRF